MPVQMELSRIITIDISEEQMICLKEIEGDRSFPIVIGKFEAKSIERSVRGIVLPRPQTHDLLVKLVDQLGWEFDSVVITELKEHTYFAVLRLKKEGELVEIDSRPSDAIAVAVTCSPPLPIFVSEDVLNDVLGE